VYIDQQQSPVIRFDCILDSIHDGNTDLAYYSKTIDVTVTVTPELELQGAENGTWSLHAEDISGSQDFAFGFEGVITTDTRAEMAANPGTTVQATVFVRAEYTDFEGRQPRAVSRSVIFALNYAPPARIELAGAAIAGLGGAGAIGLALYVGRRAKLEELFLMHNSGALIRHWTHDKGRVDDGEGVSGMLVVLQEFIRDSFDDRESNLERLRFGKQQVVLVRGQHTILAGVARGRYMNGLPGRLQQAVWEFEGSCADVLPRWDGNVAVFERADFLARRFLRPRHRGVAS